MAKRAAGVWRANEKQRIRHYNAVFVGEGKNAANGTGRKASGFGTEASNGKGETLRTRNKNFGPARANDELMR